MKPHNYWPCRVNALCFTYICKYTTVYNNDIINVITILIADANANVPTALMLVSVFINRNSTKESEQPIR